MKTAQRNMKLYKFKLFLLAMLGYAYICSVLALLLAFIGLLFWSILTGKGLNSFFIQFEIGLIIVTAVILRSLWMRLAPPQGLRLAQREQPRLFEMIDQIRRVVRGPRLRAVILTEEFNASVVSVPRLGLFGWPRHYLLIGLPLMHALSPSEFRAAIAHEMGHLAAAHGRFSSWIYRINSTWFRLMCELTGRRQWASIFFNRFFRWYVPYFGSYSATLLHSHEFEADLSAAEAVSIDATAGALVRLEVYRPFVNQFWRDLWLRTTSESSPPAAFTELMERLRGGVREDDARRWLEGALADEASDGDSHPSLGKRLEALRTEAQLPEAVAQPAAEFYLENDLQRLVEELNRNYQERNGEEWQQLYQEFREATDELSELERRAAEADLTVEETYRRACLTAEVRNSEGALLLYREVLDRDPDHVPTNFQLGRLLLSQKQDEGIRFLERAMDLNEDYTYSACHILYDYFANKSAVTNHIAAQNYLRCAEAQFQVLQNAQAERNEVSFLDHLMTHDLSHDRVEQLRRKLAQDDQVREAYLVRKEVRYRPDKPLYALGVVVDRPWYRQITRQWSFTRQFAYELKSPVISSSQSSSRPSSSLQRPFELYSFELGGHDKRLRATFRDVDNSLIYERACFCSARAKKSSSNFGA
jgi:Zn-dependent protease with chaperone function